MDSLDSILRCPRCLSCLEREGTLYRCADPTCLYGAAGTTFPVAGAQPVLIDFEESIFDRESYIESLISRPPGGAELGSTMQQRAQRIVRRTLRGENRAAKKVGERFLAEAKINVQCPKILIVGGGTEGSGSRYTL